MISAFGADARQMTKGIFKYFSKTASATACTDQVTGWIAVVVPVYIIMIHGTKNTRRPLLCQGLSFGRVGADTATDKILEVGFTRNKKFLANPAEHFLAGGAKLGPSHFKCELFALAGADEAKLHFDL